jgi:hypothetical protein
MEKKIKKYRKDRLDHFSATERIMAAQLCPDLFNELMPEKYWKDPIKASMALDNAQRLYVWNRKTGLVAGWKS